MYCRQALWASKRPKCKHPLISLASYTMLKDLDLATDTEICGTQQSFQNKSIGGVRLQSAYLAPVNHPQKARPGRLVQPQSQYMTTRVVYAAKGCCASSLCSVWMLLFPQPMLARGPSKNTQPGKINKRRSLRYKHSP